MADKSITAAELLELVKDGAKVKTENHPTIIAQFDELLSKLDTLAEANAARITADKLRSQTQLEVLATLQALIRQGANPAKIDLGPLQTALTELQPLQVEPRPAYEFVVERDKRSGYIEKITAVPQVRVLN